VRSCRRFLCGHDHTLQHLQESANSTQYFVSGNGAKRGQITPIPQQLFGVVDPGFMLHSIRGKTEMSTAVVDFNGKTIYSQQTTQCTTHMSYVVS